MRYGSLTRAEDDQLVQILGGEEVVRLMIARSGLPPVEPPKFGDWTRGQTEGIIQKLGKLALRIASGELEVDLKDGVVVVQEATKSFFDQHGRAIPFIGSKGFVDANRSFHLTQPTFNYSIILARLQEHFGKKYKFLSAKEFEERCNAVLEFVRGDAQFGNLARGVFTPFALPWIKRGDIGKILDNVIVPALDRSYSSQFPDRRFLNHCHGELENKVTVVEGTRQDRVINAMADGPVCGVYFPTAFQGFRITASREFISRVPGCLVLSGVELLSSVVAFPEVFSRDIKTQALDLASLQWQYSESSLYFHARDDGADFDGRLLRAHERCSGGVSVLG